MGHSVQGDLGASRWFVRVVNAGETLDFPSPCLGVHALDVAPLAHLQGRVHEHFHIATAPHHVAHVIACCPVGTHGCTNHRASVAHDFGSDEADAPDIDVPILFAKPETLRQVSPYHIAIQNRDLAPVFLHQHSQYLGRRGLARTAESGEPDAHALLVPRWIDLTHDLSHFGPGEPFRQLAPVVQVLLAHLGARD